LWFLLKVLLIVYLFIWIRATLPRMRYDRLMVFGWKFLIPFGLVWVVLTGAIVVLPDVYGRDAIVTAFGVAFGALVAVSLVWPLVAKRAAELGIRHLFQGADDKLAVLEGLRAQLGFALSACGYMGDDLPDLPLLVRCGFAATVPDAPEAVRARAHYVSRRPGGRGAVREVCEVILAARGALDGAVGRYLA